MTQGRPDGASAPRSRWSLLAEGAVIGGVSLLAVFWIIPNQTSEGGIGLSPAFLPTLCAAACGVFAVADVLLRLARRDRSHAYPQDWTAFVRIGAVALLGTAVLRWGGVTASALVTVPAGMLVLGERRPLRIVGATLFCAGIAWLMSR